MRYRQLDKKGDMCAVEKAPLLQGGRAVAQALKTRLMQFSGEWWEDEDLGIPLGALLGTVSNQKIAIADAYIKSQIADTEGVDSISSYTSTVSDARVRSIHVEVTTVYGDVQRLEVAF